MKNSHCGGKAKYADMATKGMNRGLTLVAVQGIIRRFPLF
ncbi:hypothetical protein J417_18490 [Dickeya zeae MS1]|nr:hypothetical protein J417_18490 [Dickeya zeae MS1]